MVMRESTLWSRLYFDSERDLSGVERQLKRSKEELIDFLLTSTDVLFDLWTILGGDLERIRILLALALSLPVGTKPILPEGHTWKIPALKVFREYRPYKMNWANLFQGKIDVPQLVDLSIDKADLVQAFLSLKPYESLQYLRISSEATDLVTSTCLQLSRPALIFALFTSRTVFR
ncbi:hypothetical protein M422DRAFT_241255 [Sphaerobolus stellatus SS14]|nr:hypothetical protein M422DRAFT_241255 [Sphaerobolus stellatus SS14]